MCHKDRSQCRTIPVFVNDNEVNCQIKLFADDTNTYAIVDNPLVTSITHYSYMDRIKKCLKMINDCR